MPWLVAVWTTVTLCLGVCHVSVCTNCKVFRIPFLVLLQIIESMLMLPILKQLHWLPVKYRCMFKTATLVYKFLHSGSPSYSPPFLSLSCCSYSTRHSHPDRQYLTVPPFRSSVFKSVKHFDHSFEFDAPKIWNKVPRDVRGAAFITLQ